jgi:hypothetical protein
MAIPELDGWEYFTPAPQRPIPVTVEITPQQVWYVMIIDDTTAGLKRYCLTQAQYTAQGSFIGVLQNPAYDGCAVKVFPFAVTAYYEREFDNSEQVLDYMRPRLENWWANDFPFLSRDAA